MKRLSSALSSSITNLSTATSAISNAVLEAPSAISNTIITKISEDNDLRDFDDKMFGEDLCYRLDREFDTEYSIDSGVVTEQNEISYLDQTDTPHPGQHRGMKNGDTSRSVSSISLSSDEDFLAGLNFDNIRDLSPMIDPKDDITRVTCDILSSSEDSEFDLDITSTEVFLARQRNVSADSRTAKRTLSLNHSGNLSEIRRSFNESDLKLSFNEIKSNLLTNRSLTKSNVTLSDHSTPQNSSNLQSSRSRSELTLNSATLNTIQRNTSPRVVPPIIEEKKEEKEEEEEEEEMTALQLNNYLELSQQDPTTIESFDYSSLNILDKPLLQNMMSQEETDCDTVSDFDEDEDLLDRKDPFRESFLCGVGTTLKDNLEPQNTPDPCSFIKNTVDNKLINRNSGSTNKLSEHRPSPKKCPDVDNDDVIETLTEISVRSVSKVDKNCMISRQAPVQFKPLPKIQNSRQKSGDSFKNKNNVLYKTSVKPGNISKHSITDQNPRTFSNKGNSVNTKETSSKTTSSTNLNKTNPGKRKNILNPPSHQQTSKPAAKSTKPTPQPKPLKNLQNNDTASPRSVSQSCYNLNSKTDISLTGTLDNIHSGTFDNFNSAEVLTRSGTELITRSGTLDGFNSLDKTKSCADLTFTPLIFSTESSPTQDIAENSNLTSDNSDDSTFYSFSASSEDFAPKTADPKSSKSFMVNMRNSFKRLANFLSLSGSRGNKKKDKDDPEMGTLATQNSPSMVSVYNIIPSPPPARTKPCSPPTRNRHCVRPLSPSGVSDFTQISKSCSNISRNHVVAMPATTQQPIIPAINVDKSCDTLSNVSMNLNGLGEPLPKQTFQPNNTRIVMSCQTLTTQQSERTKKKLAPPSTLINHINSHYTAPPKASSMKRKSYQYGLSTPQLCRSQNNKTGLSTPQIYQARVRQSSEVLRSSTQSIMPQPPSTKKPKWRETKASRLRLNKVKAPSMSSLQF